MKKAILAIGLVWGAWCGEAKTITNYVYVVSNIFNNVYTESVITQKIQSTHTDYYFTNYVTSVTNYTQITFRTNVNVNVIYDNFDPWVIAASNQADNASSFASSAAASATDAASSASAASASAASASAAASNARSAAADGLNRINARINWFDEHSGQTITMVTTNININVSAQDWAYVYTNADGVAYSNVLVHPYGTDGGVTVKPYRDGTYSSVGIRAWPRPRVSGYWDFYPAYVDRDENGLRLQYLPDVATPIQYQDANGAYPTGKIVPEYFYWQSGYVYFKVRVWVGGQVVAWCLSRHKWDDWPLTIGYGGNDGTAMALVSRAGYGDNSMGSALAYFHTLTRTATMGADVEFPGDASASYNSTLVWMRDGPAVSELQDLVASLSAQWTAVQGDWAAFRMATSNRLDAFDARLANADAGYPHAYTAPDGTVYANMTYYDRATADGKVAITTVGNYYPSLEYRLVPNYGGDGTASYWTFAPAYIDTDANGLRLHYLPTQCKTIAATTYNAGRAYVPRDFYWQGGAIYVVIDSYDGATWGGRLTAKFAGTGADAWPNGLLAAQKGSIVSTAQYKSMAFVSREGAIMGTSTTIIPAYIKTDYQRVMASYDSVLWFPAAPSVAQQAVVDWLATWTR